MFIVAFVAPNIIQEFGAKFPYYNERLVSSNLPYFIWSFGNFDGVHYLGIAKDGYAYQFTQAFFPLYPVLIKFTSTITGFNLVISALLLSNTTFLLGLLVFYKLIKENFNQKTALWACIFLLSFPTSYYFGSVYTEGLFFLLLTSSFYFLSREKILLASMLGAFASLTRLVGVFLSVSLNNIKKLSLYPLIIVPMGLITYMLYLKVKFDNSLYFLSSQSAFGQGRSTAEVVLLPQVIFRWIKQIFTTSGLTLFNSVFELTTLIFALILLTIAWKKMNKQWIIFSILSILTPTLTGSLTSMPRYILIAFPIFVVLAQIRGDYQKVIILIVFFSLLIISSALFTRGYWIA